MLRSLIESRTGRLRALGWRGVLVLERDTLRRLLKTTLAATLAFEGAVMIHSPRPVLASLAAIIVVQVTVRATLARSIQLTVGVAFGLVAATVLGHFFGTHWWSIAIIVLAGLLAGELLHLGAMSGQAAISAMLALSLGSAYGLVRTVDTVLGAAIGVLVNALVSPPTYVAEAARALRRVAEDLAALLVDLGAGLAARPKRADLERWLDRARACASDVREAAGTVAQGEESLRFNPRRGAELTRLERIGEARRALDHAVTQARGISRTLIDLRESAEVWPDLQSLDELLRAAARSVAAFGRLQERPDVVIDRDEALAATKTALARRDDVAALVQRLDPAAESTRLLAAVLVDAERLVGEVDIAEGKHVEAVAV